MVNIDIKKISMDKITKKPCVIFSTKINKELEWSLPISITDAVHLSIQLYSIDSKETLIKKSSFRSTIKKYFTYTLSSLFLSTVNGINVTPVGVYSSFLRKKKVPLSVSEAFILSIKENKVITLDPTILPLLTPLKSSSSNLKETKEDIASKFLKNATETNFYNIENLEPETNIYM